MSSDFIAERSGNGLQRQSRYPEVALSRNACSSESRQLRFAKSLIPAICLRFYSRNRYNKITLSIPAATVEILSFVVDGRIEGERGWDGECLPRQ